MSENGTSVFHESCFACSSTNAQGLRLEFRNGRDDSTCTASVGSQFQSYKGIVHGGIIATLLDAAMVQSLHKFHGRDPLTCRLEVRFLHPVPSNSRVTVQARRIGNRGKIVLADAKLLCGGACYARARGAFTFR